MNAYKNIGMYTSLYNYIYKVKIDWITKSLAGCLYIYVHVCRLLKSITVFSTGTNSILEVLRKRRHWSSRRNRRKNQHLPEINCV